MNVNFACFFKTKNKEMKTLERNVFKLLVDSISIVEFEKYLYQEENINQIETNKFIYDLIDVNYRSTDCLYKVRHVAEKHFKESDFLLIELRFSCLKIIEADNIDDILNIISKYSIIHYEKDYEFTILDSFYNANNQLELINDNLGFYSKNEIFNNIKNFARQYLNAFDSNKANKELLNISDSEKDQEHLFYFSEEDILNYMADRKTEFLSNKSIRKSYESAGFNRTYVENVIKKIEATTISKLTQRVFIYVIIGIPFLYVGLKSYEKQQVNVWFLLMGFAGLIFIASSIIYLIQIVILIIRNTNNKP